MNDEMSAFSIIKSVASRGLADQTKHEGDRVDGRGILICVILLLPLQDITSRTVRRKQRIVDCRYSTLRIWPRSGTNLNMLL